MEKAKRKLVTLFKKYGNIQLLDESDKTAILYRFSCDTEKMYNNDNILSAMGIINFAVVLRPDDECLLFGFRVDKQDGVKKDILYVINEANKSSKYGKYTLASDGDIDWGYRFNLEHTSEEDLEDILTSFFDSLLRLVVLKRKYKFNKEEYNINE